MTTASKSAPLSVWRPIATDTFLVGAPHYPEHVDESCWERDAERMASAFCRRHARSMFLAILFSFLAMAGIGIEYFLMADFIGINLPVVQLVAALTAMQIAFLMPLPGGLGALEASQVFVLGAFGQSASAAISLTLLMRARDILNGGIGLLLAGRGVLK